MPIILVSDTRLFGEEKFCGWPFVLKYVVRFHVNSCDEKCRIVYGIEMQKIDSVI